MIGGPASRTRGVKRFHSQPEGEIVWVCPSDPEIRALFGSYGDGPIRQPSDD